MRDCPSMYHGEPGDPYGCYEEMQEQERREDLLLTQAEEMAVFDFLNWLVPQNIELHSLIPGGCSEAQPGTMWERWKAERHG